MADCMRTLNESGLRDAVARACANKPLLGVCVGEHMLFDTSEEGATPCLGIFPGIVKRFAGEPFAPQLDPKAGDADAHQHLFDAPPATEHLKVPHMGWNRVRQTRDHPIWSGIPDNTHFYFVHSYYACPQDSAITIGESEYGGTFTCAVAADNIFAVQFHPEKSADHGLRLYRNFVDWNPR